MINEVDMINLRIYLFLSLSLFFVGCATLSQECPIKYKNYDVVERVKPVYPRSAYENEIEGWAIISLTITEKGEASEVKVVESNPKNVFDDASIEAGYKMRFSPRIIDCIPIPVYDVQYRHNYTLDDE